MKRFGLFLILFLIGMLVFFVGGYWTGIQGWHRTAVKIVLPVLLLVATFASGRVQRFRKWRNASLGFLAASTAFLVSHWVSGPLLGLTGMTTDSVAGLAFAKLFDALPIVVTVLVVARLGGLRPADLFIRKGRVKAWLIVGLVSFAAFTVLFLLQASGEGIAPDMLIAYAPWALLFVFANGFMEELHFRGLLLRPFEELLGRHTANLCIALFFTLTHAPVQYTTDILFFLILVFALSYAWGYIIQRTESIWGSVLFHAGGDLLIIVGIYKTYGAGG
jgi:membrane protease YdiL (CAAX protease family)